MRNVFPVVLLRFSFCTDWYRCDQDGSIVTLAQHLLQFRARHEVLLYQDVQLNATLFFAAGSENSVCCCAIHEPCVVPIADRLKQLFLQLWHL
jgi:hypothetical protein